MNKAVIKVVTASLSLAVAITLVSWGTWGHQHINRAAVFALPENMRPFFYNHIDFLTEESVVPDIRKYTMNDKAEFSRHFIDLEAFEATPEDSLPRNLKEAMEKYNAKFLDINGMLPWYTEDMMEKLTDAFKARKKTEILYLAGNLGHYVADAHVPLHTTFNYDGQLTDQRGIHAFWESQLPELFGDGYNFYTGDAVYISDIGNEIWRIIKESHRLSKILLLTEKKLKTSFPADKIFQKDAEGVPVKNKYNQPVHSYEYAKAYHDSLHGMVENQIRCAIASTANFWYTAWVNAGKPNVVDLDPRELTARNKKDYQNDLKQWERGDLFGVKTDKEF
jgi:hypothetical protein